MKIMIVGEAWGEEEERQGLAFVGPSGRLLNQMLTDAGLNRADCYVTNVFNLRPKPTNDISNLCGPKTQGIPGRNSVSSGKYIRAEFAPELVRLEAELRDVKPNVIVPAGGTAAWAILGNGGIRRIRGTVTPSPFGKVIPVYHPAAILRDWSLRHVTVLDFMKIRREAEFPEVRRPSRKLWLDPSIADIETFFHTYVTEAKRMAVDIETAYGTITCIGFAPRTDLALVIPFSDNRKDGNYWSSFEEEKLAWDWVRRFLNSPCEKVFQNGLYDMSWLWKKMGMPIANVAHDTMLLHHSLQIESPKGLDFLGSVYTNEAAWKLMRPKGKKTLKQEE